ncbi:glycosyltransferase involved in cell wall biosynthesis [Weissella uvarum]|uniref:glycosyltransferase n=1 Tax=Weissella uvarum TaxID=1479233 RepID=UPI001961CFA0|nr:glycosyltransferase [Weissella uvarum]MBM7617963.1 glycosyltransferase involved in cell wall biosynthesis [Weissella uvarum]MCM0596182.1 glycosyltransferase [Weissella uvarum]
MKKALFITAKANMLQQFNHRNILICLALGLEVHVASDFIDAGSMDQYETKKLENWLDEQGVVRHQVHFERGIGNYHDNRAAVQALNQILIHPEEWAFVHVHSPLGGILGRISAHQQHVPAIYTAHGFQFFKGGPIKNWVFYPVEKLFSYWTDTLITINSKDTTLAEKHFKAKHFEHISGVGVDVRHALEVSDAEKQTRGLQKRAELGISPDDYVLTTIGELNDNKNQKVVLEALARLANPKMKLLIAGIGPNADMLQQLARQLKIEHQVQFLGYRTDLTDIHYAANLNVFPSLREGLGLAGLESLVDGNYVIGSAGTGMADYLVDEDLGQLVDATNVEQITRAINEAYQTGRVPKLSAHQELLLQFDKQSVDQTMKQVYQHYLE